MKANYNPSHINQEGGTMPYQYRITKYNPQNRNARGNYLLDEWTAFSDIGKVFNGQRLDEETYYHTEDAYVSSALAFLNEARIRVLILAYLENHRGTQVPGLELRKGKAYPLQEADRLFRLILREAFWGKFKGRGKSYIHFGWDYYMYLAVPSYCPQAIAYTEQQGLFVEEFESPYLK